MAEKAKGVYHLLPRLPLGYCHLSRPDDRYGNYSVMVTIPKAKAGPFLEALKDYIGDNFLGKDQKHPKWKPGYRKSEEGDVIVDAKTKRVPMLYDATGKPMSSGTNVSAGSVGTVNVQLTKSGNSDQPGVMVRLISAQIVNLVEYKGGGNVFSDVSGEVEDAYVVSDEESAAAKAEAERRRSAPVASAARADDEIDPERDYGATEDACGGADSEDPADF